MPVLPGFSTLQDLIRISQERADMVNNKYVSQQEWIDYINLAYSNLYDLLIEKYAENYPNSTPYVFAADGVNQQFPLPNDFYKKMGLDLQYNAGPQGWVTIHDSPFPERNRFNMPFSSWPAAAYANIRSRLVGNTIMLIPTPTGGQVFRLWYAPRLVPLALCGTVNLNQVAYGDTFTFNPNYSPSIQNPSGAIVPPGGNPVTFTAVVASPTGNQFISYPGNMVMTATSLAAAMNASTLMTTYGIVTQANAGQPSVTVYLPTNGAAVSWTSSNPNHFQLSLPTLWTNLFDGISGWHKLVIIDATISALSKEESDTTQLNLERAQEVARIESAAATRSPDEPNHVVNVSNRGALGWGDGGWGGNWGGGGGW